MAEVKPAEVSAILRQQLAGFNTEAQLEEVGTVLQVGDGIARIYGLSQVQSGELIEFDKTKKIFAAEAKMERIQDHSFPILSWHPTGDALAFFSERRGALGLYIHDFNSGKTVEKQIQRNKVPIQRTQCISTASFCLQQTRLFYQKLFHFIV